MIYTTWDRGNFWSATSSPTGSILRRVVVVPWYIYGGVALGPRVALLGQDGVWYYELPTPDVAISKEGPTQVAAGGEVSYTLRITNTTPLTARGVTVADTISVDHGVAAAVPSPILRGGRSTFWL
ncbi:MAG: hypothetical protein Q8R28_15525, partial [Dehalococcoidia bacterium]|nr:hypothetical protein [Dehalococcoidia bacterium]